MGIKSIEAEEPGPCAFLLNELNGSGWDGSALYTMSAMGNEIQIVEELPTTTTTTTETTTVQPTSPPTTPFTGFGDIMFIISITVTIGSVVVILVIVVKILRTKKQYRYQLVR